MSTNATTPGAKARKSGTPSKGGPGGKSAKGKPKQFPIVGICASAGGLEAFQLFLKALPREPGVAFMLVQHMDPHHRSSLPEILEKSSPLPIVEMADGIKVEPNRVYVGISNTVITMDSETIRLAQPATAEHRYRALDVFLEGLAHSVAERAMGVILSGTGSDGTRGLQEIKKNGGLTFAQEPGTAGYEAMPLNAIRQGHVDFQGTPGEIAIEICRIADGPLQTYEPVMDGTIDAVFATLRTATRVDFAGYKRSTVQRRLQRRMVLRHAATVGEYVDILREDPTEVSNLYSDLLIKVTQFYRDPDAFASLAKVLKPRLKAQNRDTPFRVWVAGCATGEEAYSVAMQIVDICDSLGKHIPIQIFGTDLSESSIAKARDARYETSIESDVPKATLDKHFIKENGQYRISKPIRDLCIFSVHNVAEGPPFSRMDLVTCRNLLIYLRSAVQERVLSSFHYALSPSGILMLGPSETTGTVHDYFAGVDTKHRIYQAKNGRRPSATAMPPGALHLPPGHVQPESRKVLPEPNATRLADEFVLRHHAPPGVIINEHLDILQFRGNVEKFLQPAAGEATRNLLRMARSGLEVELRAAISGCRKERKAVTRPKVRFRIGEAYWILQITVSPLPDDDPDSSRYLVLFDVTESETTAPVDDGTNQEIDLLRAQLRDTREHLETALQETETTNEELRTANEEALSSNEELQSTNEELQTAMEELQSTNEELTTVNEELQNRNRELDMLNSDLENLLRSADLPIVFVGADLAIRRFTPQAEQILRLIPGDVGRPVSDLQPRIQIAGLDQRIAATVESGDPTICEVQGDDGRWYELRISPYLATNGRIEGAVVMMVDVDALKRRSDETLALIAASTAIAEAGNMKGAVLATMESLCQTLGWAAAEYWSPCDDQETMILEDFYAGPDGRTKSLHQAGKKLGFKLGDGLPGEVAKNQTATRRENISSAKSGFVRHKEAKKADLKSAVGVPIYVGSGVPHVLIFFDSKPTRALTHGAEIVRAVAAQLEGTFERKHGEQKLAEKAEQLENANADLDRFARVLAHDLANPLRSSRLYLDRIRTDLGDPDQEHLDHARTTLSHLNEMVTHLLSILRTTGVATKGEDTDVSALVNAIRVSLAKRIEDHSATVSCDATAPVQTYRMFLMHALTNAIDNAIKFGGADGPCEVVVSTEIAKGALHVHVKDNGPGISAQQIQDMFEGRTDEGKERRMGMSLAKQMIEWVGGDITAKSGDKGTVVSIHIPVLS